ncbi:MAG: hypothetical protein ACFFFG_03320 [Candidatus Thorarchaeota archaeon]
MDAQVQARSFRQLLRIIYLIKTVIFITFFGSFYLPLASVCLVSVLYFSPHDIIVQLTVVFILLLTGLLVGYGIFALLPQLRGITFGFPVFIILAVGILSTYGSNELNRILTVGIISIFNDPYVISFSVVLSWFLYEIWYITARFHQVIHEYETYYSEKSPEVTKLHKLFRSQFTSFAILSWTALALSWTIIYLASHYFIELGFDFGTLGITISLAMVLLIRVVKELYRPEISIRRKSQEEVI